MIFNTVIATAFAENALADIVSKPVWATSKDSRLPQYYRPDVVLFDKDPDETLNHSVVRASVFFFPVIRLDGHFLIVHSSLGDRVYQEEGLNSSYVTHHAPWFDHAKRILGPDYGKIEITLEFIANNSIGIWTLLPNPGYIPEYKFFHFG